MSSRPIGLEGPSGRGAYTRRIGRGLKSSHGRGVEVCRRGASSGVVLVTLSLFRITKSIANCPCVAL
ncbi:hypothetical protein TNCV_56831 [Trichonephila clavipes]|nr:hypothetical protein TNCV_56831 [Trichonephila clavipes]